MFQIRRVGISNAWNLPDVITIPNTGVIIGRQQGTGITIHSNLISRKHCGFERNAEDQLCLIDYGSTNGTLLNGNFITPKMHIPVVHGDIIVFGGDKPEPVNNCSFIFERKLNSTSAPTEPSITVQNVSSIKSNDLPPQPISSQVEELQTATRERRITPIEMRKDHPTLGESTLKHSSRAHLLPQKPKRPSSETEKPPESITSIFGTSPSESNEKEKAKSGNFDSYAEMMSKVDLKKKPKKMSLSIGRKSSHLLKKDAFNISQFEEEESNEYDTVKPTSKYVLDEHFCQTATSRDLDKAVASGISISRVIGSMRSAFAISIEAKNLQFAMRVLSMQNGEADLSRSELTEIPSSVIRMVKANLITKLDVSYNKLNSIPFDILEIPKVVYTGNPLEDIPKELRDPKWPILKRNIQNSVNEYANWDIRKVIILGEEGTGKTSVCRCIEKDSKIDCSKKQEKELLEITQMKIDKMDFTLFNLGGAITSRPFHRLFIQFGAIYILTFNITRIRYAQIEYWLKLIKQTMNSGNRSSFVILVGTHAESLSEEECNDVISGFKSRFPKHVFPMLHEVIPVSCKTGLSITKLRRTIRQLASHSAFVADKVHGSWIQLYQKIHHFAAPTPTQYLQSNNYLPDNIASWEEFLKWCESFGIFEKTQSLQVARFLSDYTQFSHFERSGASHIVFRPSFFMFIFQSLCSYPYSTEVPGIVPLESEKYYVFKGADPKTLQFILQLLTKFKIIYYLSNWGKHFVPSLVDRNRPTSDITRIFPVKLPDDCVCYGRVFEFRQQPIQLFERIQCAFLNFRNIKVIALWENGVVIQYQFLYASLEYYFDSYKLMVEVRYNRSEESSEKIALHYWRQLLEMVRTQVNSWCGSVSWEELIPCIHCMRQGVFRDRVYLIEYQKVLNNTSPFVYCHGIESASRCIDKTEVAPDISLMDLPQVNERKLKIGEQIGEGGFGKVYKGSLDQTVVAVKELSGELDGDRFREFQAECFVQCLLDHENIVKLYGVTANPPRMILQFINGGDLYHLLHPKSGVLAQADFKWADRWRIAFDIAKGLYHMQSQNPPIIHRDLRSPNIFLTSTGNALIGDFGLAKLVNPEVGGVLGTWQWLAPECISINDLDGYDERTDIYSLGIVLWELAAIECPFDEYGNNPSYAVNGIFKLQEVKRAIIEDNLRPTIPPNTPKMFADIIEWCWATDIQKRPSSKDVLEHIATAIDQLDQYKTEISRAPIDQSYLKLGSHLKLITQTSVHDRPMGVFRLSPTIGKPRRIVQVNECVYVGTSKGYFSALVEDTEADKSTSANQLIIKNYRKDWKAHNGRVASVIFVPPSSLWSCSDDDGNIRIWNHTSAQANLTFYWKPFPDALKGTGPNQLLFDYVNDRVWCGSSQKGSITVWNIHDRSLVHTITDESLIGLSGMELHRGLVWIANEGKIMMYDAQSFEYIGDFQAHDTGRMPTEILSVDENVWTASNSEIRIWSAASIETLNLIKSTYVGDSKFECLFSRKDRNNSGVKYVYSGAFNGELIMWDPITLEPMQEVVSSIDPIKGCTVLDGNLWAISTSTDVYVYNASSLHSKIRAPRVRTLRILNKSKDKKQTDNNNSNNNNDSKNNEMRKHSLGNSGDVKLKLKLANPTLRTLRSLRSQAAMNDLEELISISLFDDENSPLKINVQVSADSSISSLMQSAIPQSLKLADKYTAGMCYRICWYKSEDKLLNFVKEDLDQGVSLFLMHSPKLQIKFIEQAKLVHTLETENTQIYGILNAYPNVSATIQFTSPVP